MTDERGLLLVGDLVVDGDTGEVVEWPTEAGVESPRRIEWLGAQYLLAKGQATEWETARKVYSRAIVAAMTGAGERKLATPSANITAVGSSTQRRAPASNVPKAVALELMSSDEAAELLIAAARDLDAATVLAWIAERPEIADKLRAVLIDESPRAGYALVKPPKLIAPSIARAAPGAND